MDEGVGHMTGANKFLRQVCCEEPNWWELGAFVLVVKIRLYLDFIEAMESMDYMPICLQLS
jgi:hypothetical protein